MLKLRLVFRVPAALYTCRARGCPSVREDLPAFFFRRRLYPGTGFSERAIGIIKSRRTSLSRQQRSGNQPVEEGDWKIPQACRVEAKFSAYTNTGL
ncbi:MAG: hypothetical protein EA344_11485 [Alkalicoccus sp.]|nr:MAG: hypothetical protein EA344_11485 [Alkalicoccus sp.]